MTPPGRVRYPRHNQPVGRCNGTDRPLRPLPVRLSERGVQLPTRPSGWGTEGDSGRCSSHGGSGGSGDEHEGNDWAAKHGAYSDSFVQDFLTEEEIERLDR